MRRRLLVGLALAACTSNASRPNDASDVSDLGRDAQDTVTDAADTPRPHDVSHDPVVVDVDAETGATQQFRLRAPAAIPRGMPVPLLVHAVDDSGAIDAAVGGLLEVRVGDAQIPLIMRRGVGSVTTEPTALPTSISIAGVELGEMSELSGAQIAVEGDLEGDLVWSSTSPILVQDDVRVAGDLRVEPGTWVAVSDDANIEVSGELVITGTEDAPVVFAPSEAAWGGLIVGSTADISHAVFVGGGADTSREFGHSNSQAVVFGENVEVTIRDSVFQDSPGKAMGARGGNWRIERTLVTRTDTGGEFEHSAVTIVDSHYYDFPELDPAPRDDDNDGIYLLGDPDAADPPDISIRRTTFISGADDGIDHNGSVVTIEESWIAGFDNECIAASSGGRLRVSDTALFGCGQGLEAGYGSPTVEGTHLLVMECGVGLRFGDSYSRQYTGTLSVTESVIAANHERAVWNWRFGAEAPAEGRVSISRSLLDADEAEGGEGNVVGTPELTDGLLLEAESPGAGIAADGLDPGLRTARPR